MKRICFLIFIFYYHSANSCEGINPFQLVEELKSLEKSVIAKDCTHEELLDKEEICDCAQKNLHFFGTPKKEIGKKFLVDKALDKAKAGLLSIGLDILNLSQNPYFDEKDFLGESCDIKNRLESDSPTNSVFNCPKNNKGTHILSVEERRNKSRKIAKIFKAEFSILNDSQSKETPGSGFITKELRKNQCQLPDGLMSQLNSNDYKINLLNLSKVLKSMPGAYSDGMSFDQIIQNIEETNEINKTSISRFLLQKLKNTLKGSSQALKLLNQPDFLKKLTNNDMDTTDIEQLISQRTSSDSFNKELIAKVKSKCHEVFKNIEDTICMTHEQKIMPEENTEFAKEMISNVAKKSQENKYNILDSSLSLQNNYCNNKKSQLDILKTNINSTLPPIMRDTDIFKHLSKNTYFNNYRDKADFICKKINAPPITQESIRKAIEHEDACGTEKDNPKTIYNQTCTRLKAFEITYNFQRTEKINKLASLKAKEEAKKSGKKVSAADIAKRTTEIAGTMLKDMDLAGISKAMIGLKGVENISSNSLLADFLGEKTSKANKAPASITTDSTSTITDATISENSQSQAMQGLVTNKPTQSQPQQAPPSARDTYNNKMDDLFGEIARRLDRSPQTYPLTDDPSTRSPISNELAAAITSPYPTTSSSQSNSGHTANAETYDPKNNYTETKNAFNSEYANNSPPLNSNQALTPTTSQSTIASNNEQNRLAPSNKPESETTRKMKSLNNAFGSMKKATDVMNSRIPASATPAPVTISGVSAQSLATEVPELTIPTGDIDKVLEELVVNLQVENKNGEKKTNTKEAQNLLKLLGAKSKKSFYLTHKDNEEYKVLVYPVEGEYKVQPYGNQEDTQYNNFVDQVRDSLSLKNGFKELVGQIRSIFSTENVKKEARPGLNYGDIQGGITKGSNR
jgi:hypothetical protein